MSLDDYKLKNPESRNLRKEILDMRYEAVENFRNKSLDQAKEARSKKIENEKKKKKKLKKIMMKKIMKMKKKKMRKWKNYLKIKRKQLKK